LNIKSAFKALPWILLFMSGHCRADITTPKAPKGGRAIVYANVDTVIRSQSRFLRGRLKSNLNLVLVLFMGIIDKTWDEHKRTIPERFHRERMETNRAAVAWAEDVWTPAALSAAQSD
jgi:hypothetical protein